MGSSPPFPSLAFAADLVGGPLVFPYNAVVHSGPPLSVWSTVAVHSAVAVRFPAFFFVFL